MRMRNVFSLAVVVGFLACVGMTDGPTANLNGDGGGFVSPVVDGGDAGDAGDGGDAGDAGDAGLVYDGGCGADFNTQASDLCFGGGLQIATGLHSACQINIYLAQTLRCSGTIDVRNGSFDGGCGAFACAAPGLPGTIVCQAGVGSTCQITMCRAGQDAGCP